MIYKGIREYPQGPRRSRRRAKPFPLVADSVCEGTESGVKGPPGESQHLPRADDASAL